MRLRTLYISFKSGKTIYVSSSKEEGGKKGGGGGSKARKHNLHSMIIMLSFSMATGKDVKQLSLR